MGNATTESGAGTPPKTVKLTKKVRRGLGLVFTFFTNSLSPDMAPGYTRARQLTGAERSDIRAATAWLARNVQGTGRGDFLRAQSDVLLLLAGQ